MPIYIRRETMFDSAKKEPMLFLLHVHVVRSYVPHWQFLPSAGSMEVIFISICLCGNIYNGDALYTEKMTEKSENQILIELFY